MSRRIAIALFALSCLLPSSPAQADRVVVAVAANFVDTARQLAAAFEHDTGHRVDLVAGSTGKHYAQAVNGAPFDILLAADLERPALLEREGLAVPGSRFTYALGRLVLHGPGVTRGRTLGQVLADGAYRHLALANPRLAPYGRAAQQALEQMGLWARFEDRLVYGENVGQVFRFVDSGAAEIGFVALSQVRQAGASGWIEVPSSLYRPIVQQAVRLGEAPAAAEFHDFLRGERAREVIRAAGYGVPDVR